MCLSVNLSFCLRQFYCVFRGVKYFVILTSPYLSKSHWKVIKEAYGAILLIKQKDMQEYHKGPASQSAYTWQILVPNIIRHLLSPTLKVSNLCLKLPLVFEWSAKLLSLIRSSTTLFVDLLCFVYITLKISNLYTLLRALSSFFRYKYFIRFISSVRWISYKNSLKD